MHYLNDDNMCISNRIGPPVEGDNFYGRSKEIALANRLLDSMHSLLLSAPRRIGKSSLAKKLIQEKQTQGWTCVYIDLEEISTEQGFLKLMIEALEKGGVWKQITGTVSQEIKTIRERVEKISIGPVGVNLTPRANDENLYNDLKELIQHDKDTFIVVDELSLFLGNLLRSDENNAKVKFILNWLRSLRQVSQTKVRWLFCGSVGLKNFTSALNLGYTVNDLTEFSLDELSREEAYGLLSSLCRSESIGYSDDIIHYALDKLYWNIPYFIQVLFSKLVEMNCKDIDKKAIDIAYRQLCSDSYLRTWSERLSEYRELEIPARKILKTLSQKPEGLKRDVLLSVLMSGENPSQVELVDLQLSRVLDMLENDGYLIKKESIRTFRSPLLRDYWYERYVQ